MSKSEDRWPNGVTTCDVATRARVVFLYEDGITGRRARQLSDLAVMRLGYGGSVAVSGWRFDLLDAPGMGETATREAQVADLMVVALRSRVLPEKVQVWLENVLEKRETGAALVALFDRFYGSLSDCEPGRTQLQRLADRSRMTFFAAQSVAMDGPTEPAVSGAEGEAASDSRELGTAGGFFCMISAGPPMGPQGLRAHP